MYDALLSRRYVLTMQARFTARRFTFVNPLLSSSGSGTHSVLRS